MKFSTTVLTAMVIPITVVMPSRSIPTHLGQNNSPWTLGRGKRKKRQDFTTGSPHSGLFYSIPNSAPQLPCP